VSVHISESEEDEDDEVEVEDDEDEDEGMGCGTLRSDDLDCFAVHLKYITAINEDKTLAIYFSHKIRPPKSLLTLNGQTYFL
jgi:hypothetical protein